MATLTLDLLNNNFFVISSPRKVSFFKQKLIRLKSLRNMQGQKRRVKSASAKNLPDLYQSVAD